MKLSLAFWSASSSLIGGFRFSLKRLSLIHIYRLLAYAEKAGLTAAEGPEDWLRVARAAAQVVQNAGTYTEKPGALKILYVWKFPFY